MIKLLTPLFAALTLAGAPQDTAAPDGPVLVELFTSQSCGMCPEANALLAELGAGEDVLAIAWGVSYHDIFSGWRDEFAKPEFVERQRAYVEAGQARRVYTPHFVVNGAPAKLRVRPNRIREAVAEAASPPTRAEARIGPDGADLRLDGPPPASPATVWLVRFEPGVQTRPIGGGDNAGIDMPHYNMARSITRLGDWSGGEARFQAPPAEADLDTLFIVQEGAGGRILAAARAD